MAILGNGKKDEQTIGFEHSDKRQSRKFYGIIFGILSLLAILGFTFRTPPKIVPPKLSKINLSESTSVGDLYYIGTSYSSSNNRAQSLYYINAPQTDSALSIKVTAKLTNEKGQFIDSTVYQAGAHIFAIEYKQSAKAPVTTQTIFIKNLSVVTDGSSNPAQQVTDPIVVKADKNLTYQKPNYRNLVISGIAYQIGLINKNILKAQKTQSNATDKLAKDNKNIQDINSQNKTNLTQDQLSANQSQVESLTGDVGTQESLISQSKQDIETFQSNLKKAINIQKEVKSAKTNEEIASALG